MGQAIGVRVLDWTLFDSKAQFIEGRLVMGNHFSASFETGDFHRALVSFLD